MRKMASRRGGFTLLEIMVYSVISLLALTSIYSVLIICLRFFNSTDASSELQQNAMRVLVKLTNEVAESDSATVTTSTNPPGISFASPRDTLGRINVQSDGLYWQSFICYYVDSSTPGGAYLYRKQTDITATPTLSPNVTNLMSANTPALFRTMDVKQQLLDTNVSTFTPRLVGNSLSISLVLDKRDPGGSIIRSVTGSPMNEVQMTTAGVLIRN